MIRLQLEHGPGPSRDDVLDRGMIAVCCDAFDAAVAADLIRADKTHGRAYVAAAGKHWVIGYCPFCGLSRGGRTYVLEEAPAPVATILPAAKRRAWKITCSKCGVAGHQSRTCGR